MDAPLTGKTVVLAVTGSIAAYKAVSLARLLVRAGVRVLPVMTASAKRFLGPVTLAGICGEAVAEDMWDPRFAGEMHVSLGEMADLVAIVPATADVLARLSGGRADDLVTALALCARGPILAAPAMHPRMWSHPATERNVLELGRQGRVEVIGPVFGEVASEGPLATRRHREEGESRVGRMSEPEEIFQAIAARLAPRDLAGRKFVITAGPTLEDLDPVRFLGNRSTGKMGFALAERAAARGAKVTLVAGPVALTTPRGVERCDVRTALEMREALRGRGAEADCVIMAAAVADYRPSEASISKLKKVGESVSLALTRNPDLLGELGASRSGKRPVLVGFALETGPHAEVVSNARGKLTAKKVDLIVANGAADALAHDDNRASLVHANGVEHVERMSKRALSDRILDWVKEQLGA